MNIDWFDVINTACSIAGIVLAVLAIVLSLWFFVLAKNSEGETKQALEGIRTQTDALQRLAGRWLDRFTKHLVEQKPVDMLLEVATQVSSLPERIGQYLQINVAQIQQNRSEIISCYLALQYYSAQTNVLAQASLPSLAEFNETNEWHHLVRQIVDQSAADVRFLEGIIGTIPLAEVERNSLTHLRQSYLNIWRNHVRTAQEFFAQ